MSKIAGGAPVPEWSCPAVLSQSMARASRPTRTASRWASTTAPSRRGGSHRAIAKGCSRSHLAMHLAPGCCYRLHCSGLTFLAAVRNTATLEMLWQTLCGTHKRALNDGITVCTTLIIIICLFSVCSHACHAFGFVARNVRPGRSGWRCYRGGWQLRFRASLLVRTG